MFKKFLKSSKGQAVIEYAVIVAMLSIAAVTVMTTAGGTLNNTYNDIVDLDWGSGNDETKKYIPKAVLSNGNLNFICDEIPVEKYKEMKTDYRDDLGNTTIEEVYNIPADSKVEFGNRAFHYQIVKTENIPAFSGLSDGLVPNYVSVNFDESFRNADIISMDGWFADSNVRTVRNMENINGNSLKSMVDMFSRCRQLELVDSAGLDVSHVRDLSGMFGTCMKLESIDVSKWDVSNVTKTRFMFQLCIGLKTVDVGNWKTENITDMHGMFCACSSLSELNVSAWETGNVKDMGKLFDTCKFKTLNIQNWDTSNVTDLSNLFGGCTDLISVDIRNWDTSHVTNMSRMFNECSSMISVDLNNWTVNAVTDMCSMFSGCRSLTSIDLSNWNTEKLENISDIFRACSSVEEMKLGNWVIGGKKYAENAFSGCSSLKKIYCDSDWTKEYTGANYCLFSGCTQLSGDIPFDEKKCNLDMANTNGYFTPMP